MDLSLDERGRIDFVLSLRRLLRIMTENGDPRGPLRAEAI